MVKTDFQKVLDSLSDEQKSVLLAEQKRQYELATVRAKRESVRRTLDNQDRDEMTLMLKEFGCETKVPLNSMRTLSLRWILSNDVIRKDFGLYVKSVQDRKKTNSKSVTGKRQVVPDLE